MNLQNTGLNEMEQIMLDHVKVVFSVAMQLAGDVAEAERLTQITIWRALRTPEHFENNAHPKSVLLAMLRRNFSQSLRVGAFTRRHTEAALEKLGGESSCSALCAAR